MQNKTLERIIQYLIIYSALLDNIGLMNGKTGIAYSIVSRCSNKTNIPALFCREYIHVLYNRINRIEPKDPTAIHLLNQLQQIRKDNIIACDFAYVLLSNRK